MKSFSFRFFYFIFFGGDHRREMLSVQTSENEILYFPRSFLSLHPFSSGKEIVKTLINNALQFSQIELHDGRIMNKLD